MPAPGISTGADRISVEIANFVAICRIGDVPDSDTMVIMGHYQIITLDIAIVNYTKGVYNQVVYVVDVHWVRYIERAGPVPRVRTVASYFISNK